MSDERAASDEADDTPERAASLRRPGDSVGPQEPTDIPADDLAPDAAPASDDPCGVPLLSQARDLGSVRCLPSDGVLELSVFKFRSAIPERVKRTPAT